MKTLRLSLPGAAALLLGAAFVFYVFYRAVVLSLTLDEAMSVFYARETAWLDLFTYIKPFANHHLLNTLWLRGANWTLGIYTEWVLRLPNVVAGGLYAWYAWRLSRRLSASDVVALCAFILFISNPFVTDFFSLARGYGLSFAAQTASLYYLVAFAQSGERRLLWRTLTAAAIAVISNFTFLNFYLALLALLAVLLALAELRKDFPQGMARLKDVALFTLIFAALIAVPLYKLKSSNSLWFGGTSGFFQDCVLSFFRCSYSGQKDLGDGPALMTLVYSALALTGIFGALSVYDWAKERFVFRHSYVFYGIFMLLTVAAGVVLQHQWLKTPYLVNRTTLLFYPLLALAWASGTAVVMRRWNARWPAVLAALAAIWGFYRSVNTTFTIEWVAESQTKEVIGWFMQNETGRTADNRLTLAIDYTYGATMAFYVHKHGIDWMHRIQDWSSSDKPPQTEYLVIHASQVPVVDSLYRPLDTLPGPKYRLWDTDMVIMKKR